MARPTKPKDLKPKTDGDLGAVPEPDEGGAKPALDLKYIVLIAVILISTILGSAGSTYLMTTMFVVPEIAKGGGNTAGAHGAEGEEGDAEGGDEHGEAGGYIVGMNLEMDEFMVNLKTDPTLGGNQYLRTKLSMSIKVPTEEDCYAKHAYLMIENGKVVGAAAPVDIDTETLAAGGGGGPSCEDTFKGNMARYVPAMRDIINAALMKRTATSLAILEGQEALKDEIKEQVNQIVAPNYEVLRVNFQDFIIQK